MSIIIHLPVICKAHTREKKKKKEKGGDGWFLRGKREKNPFGLSKERYIQEGKKKEDRTGLAGIPSSFWNAV